MERWSCEAINQWWQKQRWPVGINYVTSDAVNDIEMWMDSTFNAPRIEKELKLAVDIHLNSVRVFLSYAVWYNERERFLSNFDTFLNLADKAGLTVMPVLFDDCAFDFASEPVYGPQPDPVPGVHNSRWVPSPGFIVQDDPTQESSCEEYVRAIIGAHREDQRILVWDLYNEAGNTNRQEKALPLLQKVFSWARDCRPVQPLTACLWQFTADSAADDYCLAMSDVISIHTYRPIKETLEILASIEKQDRPILVTEWLHRPADNTMEEHLPLFFERKIGAWQWGMIQGKTQTNLNWSTMNGGTPEPEPALWQHDLLYPDGTPYRPEEVALIAELTGKSDA